MEFNNEDFKSKSNKEIFGRILQQLLIDFSSKTQDSNASYIQKRLKFQHVEDVKILTACRYLIEDSESAILEYRNFGLGDRFGESYLRLYGVLNSVYQQIFAIIELIEIFNYPNKKKILGCFKQLEIYSTRNKIGSHTINYQVAEGDDKNLDFYKVGQSTLRGWGRQILIVSNKSGAENFDLLGCLEKYEIYSNDILFRLINKVIGSVFSSNSLNKKWFEEMLKLTQVER